MMVIFPCSISILKLFFYLSILYSDSMSPYYLFLLVSPSLFFIPVNWFLLCYIHSFAFVSRFQFVFPCLTYFTKDKIIPSFPGGSDGKESACNARHFGSTPGLDPLEEGMATHSSILTWRISWTEEPDGLQSMASHRVVHDWETKHSTQDNTV